MMRRGVSEFEHHLQATARQPQLPLHRLITIRHPAHRQHHGLIPRRHQHSRRNSGACSFTMILVSKSSPAEKLRYSCVGRVTINAAMLAAAIGIDAVAEPHVRTIVVGDDRPRVVAEELRGRSRPFLGRNCVQRIAIRLKIDRVESIGGIQARSTAVKRERDLGVTCGHNAILASRPRMANKILTVARASRPCWQ